MQGEEIILTCYIPVHKCLQMDQVPTLHFIQRNSSGGFDIPDSSHEYNTMCNVTVKLTNVTFGDAGRYYCVDLGHKGSSRNPNELLLVAPSGIHVEITGILLL